MRLRDGISFSPFSVNTSAFHGWPRLFTWREDEHFECVCVWDKTCSSQQAWPTTSLLLQRVSDWPAMSDEISMTTRLMWDVHGVRYGACLLVDKHVHTHHRRLLGRAECFIHEELLGEWGRSRFLIKKGLMEGPAACITPLTPHDLSHMRSKHSFPTFTGCNFGTEKLEKREWRSSAAKK